MARTKLPPEEYLSRARAIAHKFPVLKRFKRRRTVTGPEKALISRLWNLYRLIKDTKVAERVQMADAGEIPVWQVHYVFPGDRARSDAEYKRIARELRCFATPETKRTLKRVLAGRGRLSPWKKAYISRLRKAMPYPEAIVPITRKIAKQLPKDAVRGYQRKQDETGKVTYKPGRGVYGIKLYGIEPEGVKRIQIKDGDLVVSEPGRVWVFKRVEYNFRRGEQAVIDRFEAAAEAAFGSFYGKKKARQVFFWLPNGPVGTATGSIKQFKSMLRADYLRYIAENEARGGATDFILGIAILYQ